jgi:multiple sugar transport system ATP-binding protein
MSARAGETVGITLRTERLSLFDKSSGRAIQTAAGGGQAHG